MTATAKNRKEQRALDFFTALSSGELDRLRAFFDADTVWEPMVKDIPGAGEYTGNEIIDVFLGPIRGMFAPGDPKVHPQTIFSDGDVVIVESFSDGHVSDGRSYYNRYCWVLRFKDDETLARIHEYMDSHYVARLFGLDQA